MRHLTVICTARIYSSLKTVRAWHNLLHLAPVRAARVLNRGDFVCAALRAYLRPVRRGWAWLRSHSSRSSLGAMVQLAYWRRLEHMPRTTRCRDRSRSFRRGAHVRAPATEENYLIREMGFALARRHAVTVERKRRAGRLFFVPLFALGAKPSRRGGLLVAVTAAICALCGCLRPALAVLRRSPACSVSAYYVKFDGREARRVQKSVVRRTHFVFTARRSMKRSAMPHACDFNLHSKEIRCQECTRHCGHSGLALLMAACARRTAAKAPARRRRWSGSGEFGFCHRRGNTRVGNST